MQSLKGYRHISFTFDRGRDKSCEAAIWAAWLFPYSLSFSALAWISGVNFVEFMEKFYGSWNYSLPDSRR